MSGAQSGSASWIVSPNMEECKNAPFYQMKKVVWNYLILINEHNLINIGFLA